MRLSLLCIVLLLNLSRVQEAKASKVLPLNYRDALHFVEAYQPDRDTLTPFLVNLINLPHESDSFVMLERALFAKLNKKPMALRDFLAHHLFSSVYYRVYTDYERGLEHNTLALGFLEQAPLNEKLYIEAFSYRFFLQNALWNTEDAMRYAQRLEDSIPFIKDKVNLSFLYRQLTLFYVEHSEYERSVLFSRAGLQNNLENGIKKSTSSFYSNLANCLPYLGKKDSVIYFRKKGIEAALDEGVLVGLNVAYRNLAADYSKAGLADSADLYFEKSLEMFAAYPYNIGLGYTYMSLAEHWILNGRIEKAETLLDSIIQVSHLISPGNLSKYYKVRMQLAFKSGNFAQFRHFQNTGDSIVEAQMADESNLIKQEMMVRYETQKKEVANNQLQISLQKAKITWILSLGAASFLAIAFFTFLNIRRKEKTIEKQRRKSHELEAKISQMALEQAKRDKEQLKFALNSQITKGLQQQAANQELLEKVELLRNTSENPALRQKTNQIHQILKRQSSEDMLLEIEETAKNLYPEIWSYFHDELTEINHMEMLYCLMVALGYSSEEIATLLRRSDKAIKSLRYRIRKKLGVDDTVNLHQYIQQLILVED